MGNEMRHSLYHLSIIASILVLLIFMSISLCQSQTTLLDLDEEKIISSNASLEPENQCTPCQSETGQSAPIKITNIFLNPNNFIEVLFNKFPSESWNGWKMYVDGEEWPLEGGKGNLIIRPNAPVEHATALLIGAEPWGYSLHDIDFPCCGSLQFNIPGHGLTNLYHFNLANQDCHTAFWRKCD